MFSERLGEFLVEAAAWCLAVGFFLSLILLHLVFQCVGRCMGFNPPPLNTKPLRDQFRFRATGRKLHLECSTPDSVEDKEEFPFRHMTPDGPSNHHRCFDNNHHFNRRG